MSRYCHSVRASLSDQGVERLLADIPNACGSNTEHLSTTIEHLREGNLVLADAAAEFFFPEAIGVPGT